MKPLTLVLQRHAPVCVRGRPRLFRGSPVQLDARLLLQLRPQLVGLVHHGNVEVLLVGLADDSGLAVGAPPGVGQQKLDQGRDVWGQFRATCYASRREDVLLGTNFDELINLLTVARAPPGGRERPR